MGAGVALLIVVTWAAILSESELARRRALDHSGEAVGNLALAFAAHVDRTLLGIDQSLLSIRDEMERTPAGLDLRAAVAAAPALRNIEVAIVHLDRDGVPIASNLGVAPEPVSLAGNFFFAAHLTGGDRLAVGEPIVSPITLRCNVFASRPVLDQTGRMTGVLVVSISPGYLIDLFNSVSVGRDGAVALIGDTGIVWARAGTARAGCGRRLADLPGLVAAYSRDGGLLAVPSQLDGVERLVGFRRVSDLPLQVFVGVAIADALANAHRESLRYVVFGAVLTLLLAAGAVFIARDMTRRHRVQATLRRLNMRLIASRRTADARTEEMAASVLHVRDGISIFDSDLRLVVSNYVHRRLLAYPDELARPGTRALDLLRFQAMRGDFGPVANPEAEAQRQYHEFRHDTRLHFERMFPDGRRVLYNRAITPGGSIVTLYRDVTEERRQIAELRDARQAAIEAAERKSELLGVVGHEIRTPMTGILGFLNLIGDTGLTREQRTYLGLATSSSRALLALLDDLLTHSRIEAGRLELQLADWHLDALLQDSAALFRSVAARKGVEIVVATAPGLPAWIITDGVRLRQVLGNLLANAVRMTPAGVIVITVDPVEQPSSDAGGVQQWLRIGVEDDGPGVPDGEKSTIFEPYVQGSAAAHSGEGTGLGLAICRRLLDLFGGRIGVQDAPGGGALFWFTIPLAAALPPLTAVARYPVGRLRTLVAEDNPANQYLARRFLERLGHDATIVPTADGATARLEAEGFDLIILDRRLSDTDGLDLLRWVRARRDGDRVSIIMVTATVSEEVRREALAAGADQFLCKPYAIEDLATAIALAWAARHP